MKLFEVLADDIEQFKLSFHNFMNSRVRNQWLAGGDTIQIYMRKGNHLIGGQVAQTLDIANIHIDETQRGKGAGSTLINWLHEQNPFPVTHVESIQNPRLYKFLKREGWIDVPDSKPPSVYKTK